MGIYLLETAMEGGQPVLSARVISLLLTMVIGYFFGCVNGSILISKLFFHDDIRNHGSGNAGLTNFYRTFGTKGVVGVLLSDILKAVLGTLIGGWLFEWGWGMMVAGQFVGSSFVLIGHMYPVTFRFHGGKGVLSGVSGLMVVDWRIGLAALGVFFVVVLLTKYVSLGSICGPLTMMVGMWLVYHDWLYVLFSALPTVLIIFAHRSNIKRLIRGEESKFSFKRKGASS